MAKKELAHIDIQRFSGSKEDYLWKFNNIKIAWEPQKLKKLQADQLSPLVDLLNIGHHRFFKAWRISMPLKVFSLLAAVTAIGWTGYAYRGEVILSGQGELLGVSFEQTLTWGGVVASLGALMIYLALEKLGIRLNERVSRWAVGLGVGLVGWLPAAIHVRTFDRFFLKKGRLDPQQQSTGGLRDSDPATNEVTRK